MLELSALTSMAVANGSRGAMPLRVKTKPTETVQRLPGAPPVYRPNNNSNAAGAAQLFSRPNSIAPPVYSPDRVLPREAISGGFGPRGPSAAAQPYPQQPVRDLGGP